MARRCFGPMFDAIGRHRIRFDDFSANGLLLPATEAATVRTGMPLHRGPHRRYTEVVIARVGRIEADWAETHCRDQQAALTEALLQPATAASGAASPIAGPATAGGAQSQ